MKVLKASVTECESIRLMEYCQHSGKTTTVDFNSNWKTSVVFQILFANSFIAVASLLISLILMGSPFLQQVWHDAGAVQLFFILTAEEYQSWHTPLGSLRNSAEWPILIGIPNLSVSAELLPVLTWTPFLNGINVDFWLSIARLGLLLMHW